MHFLSHTFHQNKLSLIIPKYSHLSRRCDERNTTIALTVVAIKCSDLKSEACLLHNAGISPGGKREDSF